MEYGIKKIDEITFCANCGRVVSETGEFNDNFCFKCGNPLKIEALLEREKELSEFHESQLAKHSASDEE